VERGLTRRELVELGAAGAAGVALSGVFADAALAAPQAPRMGGTLTVAFQDGGGAENLNPMQQPLYINVGRSYQIYERLFDPLPNLAMGPRLALSATANKDATRWQVKLRKGVKWHDGKPFTADDVLYSIRYMLDPKTKSEGIAQSEPIDIKASRKVSPTEIVFHLKRPIGDFKRLLGQKTGMIIQNGTKSFAKPIGTGPYTLLEWKPGVRTRFGKFEDYWGKSYLDELVFLTIADPAARLDALLSGQAQAIIFIDFAQAAAQKNNKKVKLLVAKAPQTVPITMRMDLDPFKDTRTRTAFKLAADRPKMVSAVFGDYGQIMNDLFGKGYPSYNSSLPQRTYDPDRAKALLKAAGQEGIKVTLYTSSAAPGMLESATAYKELAKAAGITIDLVKLPSDSYFSNDKYLKVPMYQSSWGAAFESVAQDGFFTNSPYNETAWKNPGWEKSFRKAQGIADDAKRNAAYKALQVPLYKEDGYLIWGASSIVDALSSNVNGLKPSPQFPLGMFLFKDAWLSS
jgi:peptide/nickel transport system substrate-binding protein